MKKSFHTVCLIIILLILFEACATTSKYEQINEGETRQKIITLLGDPADPDKDFNKEINHAIKQALGKTNNKDAKYFLFWKEDESTFYMIGFTAKDLVAVKHRLFILD